MRRVAPAVIALFALPLFGLAAQAQPSAEAGQTVRLKTASVSHWLVGTLIAQDGDSLRVQRSADGTQVTIGRRTVRQLQVKSGRHSNWRPGAFIGFLIGGASGGIIGYSHGNDAQAFLAISAEEKAILGGLAGAAGGALVGGIIGAATYSDSWLAVPAGAAQVSLAPRGLGLAVSVRF